MNESITCNSSSFLASCLGFGSAQRARENYKESKYTDCCREIAYAIGTLSCVISLGVLTYAYLSSDSKDVSNDSPNSFEKTDLRDLAADAFFDLYSICESIAKIGFTISSPDSAVRKVRFNPDVKTRLFFTEKMQSCQWSSRAQQLVTKARKTGAERVGIRYILNNQPYLRLKG